MKKFKFRLETVLKERKRQLDTAQMEYSKAQAKVDQHLALIKKHYDLIDNSRTSISKMQSSTAQQGHSINLFESMVESNRSKIKVLRSEVRELMRIAEEKRDIMTERSKELKIITKLKENQKIDYLKVKRAKDIKKLDEVVSQRYKKLS